MMNNWTYHVIMLCSDRDVGSYENDFYDLNLVSIEFWRTHPVLLRIGRVAWISLNTFYHKTQFKAIQIFLHLMIKFISKLKLVCFFLFCRKLNICVIIVFIRLTSRTDIQKKEIRRPPKTRRKKRRLTDHSIKFQGRFRPSSFIYLTQDSLVQLGE